MTRLPLNRTAWAGLALFFLFIISMTFAAGTPNTTDSASTTQMQDRQPKSEEEKRADQRDMEKQKLRVHLMNVENQLLECKTDLKSKLRIMREFAKRVGISDLSKKTREKLFVDATQSMYEIRTDIAVKQALIAHLKKSSETPTKPTADKIAALETDLVVLEAKKQVAEEYLKVFTAGTGKSVEIEIMQFDVRVQKKRLEKLYERFEDIREELRFGN